MVDKLDIVFEDFLNVKSTYCSSKSCDYYKDNVQLFIQFCERYFALPSGELSVSRIDKRCLLAYVNYLRNKSCHGKPGCLSNTSIRTYMRAVKCFLSYCTEEQLYSDISYKRLKLPKDDAQLVEPLYQFEVESIDKLFNKHTMQGLRNYCILHLMLDAGLRSGEVVHLRLRDLNFDKRYIMIYDSKYNKSRIVPMADLLYRNLSVYVSTYRLHSSGSVFIGKSQQPITSNTIKMFFYHLKQKSGIQRIHAHILRHTFATSYILGGGNLEMLRMLLGHFDYSVTRNYLHLANQYKLLHADIYRLDNIFFEKVY
ncbi:MAG: tyrosine-type recombinase/integrase [Eubacteriales bacterium]|nr:tyrosine-type recombinase/integrase [Eubacteriales bacterium]